VTTDSGVPVIDPASLGGRTFGGVRKATEGPAVEEGALAPVSEPPQVGGLVPVVSRRSQNDLLNHRAGATSSIVE
jgi:hypothetical protein